MVFTPERIESIKESRTLLNHICVNYLAKRVRRYRLDPDLQERLQGYKCKHCWYIRDFIGGAGFTKSQCRICDKEMTFLSTITAHYCEECARQYHACRWCGAGLEG